MEDAIEFIEEWELNVDPKKVNVPLKIEFDIVTDDRNRWN